MRLIVCPLAVLAFATATVAYSQNYPTRPVRIVTAGVGGSSDFASRVIAQAISGPLGQQVIVDNRPSGVIPGEIVAKSPPDGYTLLVSSNLLWIQPFLRGNMPYDAARDFLPISQTNRQPSLVVVHPSLPVRTMKEFIALVKARPGELNYAAGAIGSQDHLAAELFKSMAHVNIVGIFYKTGATRMADLVGGHVQLSFSTGGTVMPHVRSGRLRALAVTSAQPTPLAPGIPTVAASGVPGYEAIQILGVFAPARTPAAIIGRLNQEIVRALGEHEVKERFLSSGVETVGTSPEEFAAVIGSDSAKWERLIKATGIRAD
ncbi:MAG TPA: tripartite tricarboxylate transporter substrate binding protein [Burkholderiales bacterium]|nr:tripartite tricarboxylate transporter substrate binding protein [Burkholderiales bacterium]